MLYNNMRKLEQIRLIIKHDKNQKNELKYLNFSSFFDKIIKSYADVAELADAPDSKSKWIFLIVILKSIDKYTGLGFGRI